MSVVLTNHPHVVIARPPRRAKKPKPGPKITGVIVEPHQPAPKPTAVIVGRRVAPSPSPEERDNAPAEAAERLWRELVRRVEAAKG